MHWYRAAVVVSLLAAGLLVGACATTDRAGERGAASTQAPAPPPPGTCDATKAQFAVGERASDELLTLARTAANARRARFIRPDEVITMEYSGDRLNIRLDRQDVVTTVTCG